MKRTSQKGNRKAVKMTAPIVQRAFPGCLVTKASLRLAIVKGSRYDGAPGDQDEVVICFIDFNHRSTGNMGLIVAGDVAKDEGKLGCSISYGLEWSGRLSQQSLLVT